MDCPIEKQAKAPSCGVYFLANDNVFDYTIAFLNSFRFHNPTISLCLIPFDENIARITAVAYIYNFIVFDDSRLLLRCDGISAITWHCVMGHFRKLIMWEGFYERFIYIDIDTLVLRPLDYMFSYLETYDFVTAASNIDDSRKFTWNDSIYSAKLLTKDQIDYAANTGFIVSRKHLVSLNEAWKTAEDYAISLRQHMFASMEQPFLNFLIVKSKASYTSFYKLSYSSDNVEIPLEIYAPDPNWTVSDDEVTSYKGKAHSAFLIHWAGQTQPRMSQFSQSILGQINAFILFLMKLRIPHRKYHRKVWLRYRRMREITS